MDPNQNDAPIAQPMPSEDNGALISEPIQVAPQEQTKKPKTGIIIGVIAAIILLIGGGIAGVAFFQISQENSRLEALRKDAESYISIVTSAKENKIYYPFTKYGEKANLSKSPYEKDYSEDSYVTNYYDHAYICLTDGQKRISGYASSELIIEDSGDCKYEFIDHAKTSTDTYDYDEKTAYLDHYAKSTYKYLTPNVKKDENGKNYLHSKYYSFEIDAEIKDKEIVVSATNAKEAESEFAANAGGLDLCTYFLKKYYKTDDLEGETPVTVPYIGSDKTFTDVIVYSELSYEEGEQLMSEFLSFIKENHANIPGVALDLRNTEGGNGAMYKLNWNIAVGQNARTKEYVEIKKKY